MADQDKQAIVGNWRVLSKMVIGKLYVTEGLNNTFIAQIQYDGMIEENLTEVKLQKRDGIYYFGFKREKYPQQYLGILDK
jgi:hypothetical protein